MTPPSSTSRGQPEPDKHRLRRPRETVIPAVSPRVLPGDGPIVAARLSVLVHELSNLLDGSLRCLDLALRDLKAPPRPENARRSPSSSGATTPTSPPQPNTPGPLPHSAGVRLTPPQGDLERRLDAVHTGLSRMATIVKEFSGPRVIDEFSGAPGLETSGTPSVIEAVNHAVEVLRPVAGDYAVEVSVGLPEVLDECPGAGLFGVVACALRNAIESIAQAQTSLDSPAPAGAGGAGLIHIRGGLDCCTCPTEPPVDGEGLGIGCAATPSSEPLHSHRIWLEIVDDGIGTPPLSRAGRQRVFDFGFSTKPGSAGIGLAVARDTISRLGGSITLGPRKITDVADPHRPGAILRIEVPFLSRNTFKQGER